MKIRMGFVPNSSSSSFILVLPKKPKTETELYTMVFGKRPEDEKVYDYGDNFTCLDAIKVLFADIHRKESRATPRKILEQLRDRYYCIPSTWDGGDGFYQKRYSDLFWGTAPELVEKIRQLQAKEEKLREKNRATINEYINSRIPPVPYASNFKDRNGKRVNTPQEVRAYNAYSKKVDALRKTEEFLKLDREHWRALDKIWDETRKLTRQAAKKDLELLLEKTKDKFVAVLSYADESGEVGGAMEHGDVWKKVEHVRVSHH